MAKIVILKYNGHCHDCGASLPVGSRVKKYSRKIYGLTCHSRTKKQSGVYNYRGRKIASSCNCIDYPCCGH